MCLGRAAPELVDPRPARIVLPTSRERGSRREDEEGAPPRRAGARASDRSAGNAGTSSCAARETESRGGRSAGRDGIPIPRPVAPAPRTAYRACTRTAGCLTAIAREYRVGDRPLGRSACPVRAYGDHSFSDTTCALATAQAPYHANHGICGRCVSIHGGIRPGRRLLRTPTSAPSSACTTVVPSRTRVRVRVRCVAFCAAIPHETRGASLARTARKTLETACERRSRAALSRSRKQPPGRGWRGSGGSTKRR